MTEIRINGKTAETEAATLLELAKELGLPERGVALAIDGRLARRELWAATALREGSEVIIVKAAYGG
ncbi:MAG: sulfur carrier protein ThiS [Prevotellaceae bacterium]|nr:sulfur carrier protein ThiS [Prevotellaceae bacterium]